MKFYCEECKKEISSPKKDAFDELLKNFGRQHQEDDVILCDDCYARFMRELQS